MVKLRRSSPVRQQRLVLKKLLHRAEFTAFGRHYNFTRIIASSNPALEFRNRIKIYDYNSIYAEWWHRLMEEEENVCWPGKTKYFALSSGTSGSPSKHIPVTRDMIKAIKRGSIRQILTLSNYELDASAFERGILMLGGSTRLNRRRSFFEGDLSGISASKIPFWFQHFYKPGKKISEESNWDKKLDEIVNLAPHWDVAFIVGVPAWVQIMMERIIQRHGLNSIHQVWPNLVCYVHGGVSFEPYKRSFQSLFSKPVHYVDSYLASEGFVAFQTGPYSQHMKLITDNGVYFEFIPFTEKYFSPSGDLLPHAQALHLGEVEENVPYALLLSTCAGTWRYLIGDVIKFNSVAHAEITIVGRTRHYLSMCGEHLSVENMTRAIEHCAEKFDVTVNEFCVAGVPSSSLFAHHWYVACDKSIDAVDFAKVLDEQLKLLNDDYAVERSSALREVKVFLLPPRLFYDWMQENQKMGGQHKFPRVMRGEQFENWKHFVSKNHTTP